MSDPARTDDMDRILARFGEVQEAYEHLGGYSLEAQAREVLHGLGFDSRFQRIWDLYLAYCTAAFRARHCDTVHVVLDTWKKLPKFWFISLRSVRIGIWMGITPGGATPASKACCGACRATARWR